MPFGLGNHKANLAALQSQLQDVGLVPNEGETLAQAIERLFVAKADHQALQTEHTEALAKLQAAQATIDEAKPKLAAYESVLGVIQTPEAPAEEPAEPQQSEAPASPSEPQAEEPSAEQSAPAAPTTLEQARELLVKASAKELLNIGITAIELAPNGEDDDVDPAASETLPQKINRLNKAYAEEKDPKKSFKIYEELCQARADLFNN